MSGELSCTTTLPPSSACVWGAQADAIVVARVSALEPINRPALWHTTEGGWQVVENCPYANSALSIGLEVERVLSGTVDSRITVGVGADQVRRFDPHPVRGEDGRVEWLGPWQAHRGPLRIGQRIMVGLHRYSQGWSLLEDTILGIGPGEIVFAPGRQADCLSTEPVEVNGLSIDAVAALLDCVPDPIEVQTRRTEWGYSLNNPLATHATACSSPPTPGPVPDFGHSGGEGYEGTSP